MAYSGNKLNSSYLVRRDADSFPTVDGAWSLGTPQYRWLTLYSMNVYGNLVGNADTATQLQTPMVLNLTGGVSGSVTYNGTSAQNITVTVADDSHLHDTRYYTKTQTDAMYVKNTGSTMTGNITFTNGEVLGLPLVPTSVTSATSKAYVDTAISGVTSAANTNKIDKNGSLAMTANLDMGNNKIINLASPTVGTDALSMGYGDLRYLTLSGGTMTGALNMGSQTLSNVAPPTAGSHVGDRAYNDARYLAMAGGTMSGALNMGGFTLSNVATPSAANHVGDRNYNDGRYLQMTGGTVTGALTVSGGLSLNGSTLSNVAAPTAGNHVGDRAYNDARYMQISGGTLTVTGTSTFKQIIETQSAVTISAGAITIDLSQGTVFTITLNQNITTINFTNIATSGMVSAFTLFLKQDATGSRSVSWPASVLWSSNSAPTLTSTANKTDLLSFMTYDGGTTWYGNLVGKSY